MGALDPAKVLVILVVALIVLGPERLPRVARQLGGAWRELTRLREQVVTEVRDAMPEELQNGAFLPHIPRPGPGSVSGFVTGLMTDKNGSFGAPMTASEKLAAAEDSDGTQAEESLGTRMPADGVFAPRDRDFGSVVMHPTFGDIAILPDDPSMN